MGPDVTVLARIDAKPHPSAVDEVISLLLSDTIEQKLILSNRAGGVAEAEAWRVVDWKDARRHECLGGYVEGKSV